MKINGFSLGVSIFLFLAMFYHILKDDEFFIILMGLLGVLNMYFAFSGDKEK